ncbi:DUF4145 domain-containing protein [Microbacterium sp. 22195]|uniref:DUF4145 domain-containing protein n=1 Tax=Microbacterium sp. 22195 TaxID=3453891 RepID=UPI003F82924E
MGDMHLDLMVTDRMFGRIQAGSSEAFRLSTCPRCGRNQALVVARTTPGRVYWLRCSNCGRGLVEVDRTVYPGTKPLAEPQGLPEDVAAAWDEVRSCLGVGANTSAVLVARKILLHVAVGFGLAAKNERGRAPDFAEAIAHLETEGLITRRMKPWVDRIRQVGNSATHELPAITEAEASDVASFTEQLLKLAYEMDHLMSQPSEETDEPATGYRLIASLRPPTTEWVS